MDRKHALQYEGVTSGGLMADARPLEFRRKVMLAGHRALAPFVMKALAVMLLSSCGSAVPAAPPPSSSSPLMGKPMPFVRGKTLSGDSIVPETLEDRVVVIKFFAEYCKPCLRTLPAAEKLHQNRKDVLFIGVSEDEFVADAQQIVRLHGLTFPIIHDRNNVLAGRFRVTELPVTFVVNRQGQIHHVLGPEQPEDALENVLDALIGASIDAPK